MEKATEELEEAERQEVETRKEATALQEQIEKMIQVKQFGQGRVQKKTGHWLKALAKVVDMSREG